MLCQHPASESTYTRNAQDTVSGKVALVAEGGGQRGIFTAGVLDAWLDAGHDPFDILIGTSAGSQNLTSFVARQKGYAKRLIRGLTRHKRFFQMGRGLVGKHIVDLDWYFQKTQEANRLLDLDTAKSNVANREILFTATNARDRKAYFLNPMKSQNNWVDLIKASSALPLLYKQGVPLHTEIEAKKAANTDFYLDGGLAAPLPVTEAYQRGATKIVVIRTVDEGFQAQSPWLQKISAVMCATGTCPKTIDYLLQHEHAYQKELAFIENPPEGVEVIQIFAPKKLQSKLLGSSDAQLRHDYKLGQYAGAAFLEAEGKAETHYESVAAFTKAKLAKEANEDSIRIAARLNNTLSENAQAKRSAFTLPLPAQAKADKNESRMSA
ncbi:patatin-like phospholipase family protein [Alteromonas mediterranea]|uniref:Patatin n=1 Tax=Alteromonas mediterranea TaxID=314275 RepID=A0AAC8XJG2_9ALTE|nr:patatin family protein [Alteromonas mediterranea]AFV84910.1 patatin [Alteromonas mediterranea DE1]AGP96921.1 patatin [Alteromonas mediterranea UM7]AGQ01270.1 patatin [Alteromonas mediterranea UM4b]AMJ78041.1 patatin [Alteromonas mediterranea]AMJ82190.1 patatin [Alteromonas mediterranea]